MTNAEQSYIITGNDNFITTYNARKVTIETSLKSMTNTLKGKEEEMKRISSIQEFYNNYIEYSTRFLEIRAENKGLTFSN